ncbi:MAG: urease accessory protein UreE [Xanthomonadaceae bacterium]|nr:urease accessory protein UreE [Xanthomonadaceae bacterium]
MPISQFHYLPRAIERLTADRWSGGTEDSVRLDYDGRWRRRVRLRTEAGLAFLLDLPEATELREGDGLKLEDGRIIRVHAAPEPVVDVHCGEPARLARIAWHLGNRHLPTQVLDDGETLRIRQDHVIEGMLVALGASPVRRQAAFNPEGGAYGRGRHHGHDADPPDDTDPYDPGRLLAGRRPRP